MTILWRRRFGAGFFASVSLCAAGWGTSIAEAQTASSVTSGMPLPSLGQTTARDPYHELETKYIFGFAEGADIGETPSP